MRRAKAASSRGGEVLAVRRHHHAVRGRTTDSLGAGQIGARLRLVVASDLGAEDRVPRQIVAAGKIDHQRDIAVRTGRDDVFALEPRQRRRHVGPGVEPVPRHGEVVEHRVGEAGQAKARDETLEIEPVEHVELRKRDTTGANRLHAGLVFRPPGVGEGDPVEAMAERTEDFFRLAGDRGAPVDKRPEHIEEQGFDAGHRI